MKVPILLAALCTLAACAPEEKKGPAAAPAPVTPAPPPPAAPETHSAPLPVAAAPAPRLMHTFKPSVDGFAFVNSFSGSTLPIDLGSFEKKLGLPSHYGLCGGMSAAAADYFLSRRSIPADTKPPERGTPLYSYLYSRQAASLGPMGAMTLKYAEWMKLCDDEVKARTRDELPRMLEQVKRGEVVVLGLVLEGAGGAAWDNHQVLAFDIAKRDGGIDLKVYDPNYPKQDDVAIRIMDDGSAARVGPGTRGRKVRGVFQMPYEPAVPRVEGPG